MPVGGIEVIEVNDLGGQGSKTERLFTAVDPAAMDALAYVLYKGAQKYARDNWRSCPTDEHLNHALRHLNIYLELTRAPWLRREEGTEHLSHAFCRLMMALAVHLQSGPIRTGPIAPTKQGLQQTFEQIHTGIGRESANE